MWYHIGGNGAVPLPVLREARGNDTLPMAQHLGGGCSENGLLWPSFPAVDCKAGCPLERCGIQE